MSEKIIGTWKAHSDMRYLFIQPPGSASEEDWIKFFKETFEDFDGKHIFFIVNGLEAEANITAGGLVKIIECAKENGIEKTTNAMITQDVGYGLKLKMFRTIAADQNFNLNMQMFSSDVSAEDWIRREMLA